MEFFYCKDEVQVEQVKNISSKFSLLKPSEKIKTTKPYRDKSVFDLWQWESYYFSLTHLYILSYSETTS